MGERNDFNVVYVTWKKASAWTMVEAIQLLDNAQELGRLKSIKPRELSNIKSF